MEVDYPTTMAMEVDYPITIAMEVDYPTMIVMEVDSSVVQNHSCHTVRSICALSFRIPYTKLSLS